MPVHQQRKDATIQNGPCPRCSNAERTQVRPVTEYPIEQQDAGSFGVSNLYDDSTIKLLITYLFKNVNAPHLDQDNNVNSRGETATSVSGRVWAPQTVVRTKKNSPRYSSLRILHRETKTASVMDLPMRGQVHPTRGQPRLRHLMHRLQSVEGFSWDATSTTLTYM